MRRTPVKLAQASVESLVKFYSKFLQTSVQPLVAELVDFHSATVNPRELCVVPAFFKNLADAAFLDETPHLRMYLAMSQYCKDKLRASASGPSSSSFIDSACLKLLEKDYNVAKLLEQNIVKLRTETLPILEKFLVRGQALLAIQVFVDVLIRCAFGKPAPPGFATKSGSLGKFSIENVKALGAIWATQIEMRHPGSGFAHAAGFALPEPPSDAKPDETITLEPLENDEEIELFAPESPSTPALKLGDTVVTKARTSWVIDEVICGRSGWKKDVNPETFATVVGYTDDSCKSILVKATLSINGDPRECTGTILVENVETAEEHAKRKANIDPKKGLVDSSKRKVPEEILGKSSPSEVFVLDKWERFVSDEDVTMKRFFASSRVGMCLESIWESVPKFQATDLCVVHRLNDKGVWVVEVWAHRDFAPRELFLLPLGPTKSAAVATSSSSVKLQVPLISSKEEGAGTLALDGRGRTDMLEAGIVGQADKFGSLFWLVQRTHEVSEANLVLERVSCTAQVDVELVGPSKKRKKPENRVVFESKDLPHIPVLVNTVTIKRFTLLKAFHKKDEATDK